MKLCRRWTSFLAFFSYGSPLLAQESEVRLLRWEASSACISPAEFREHLSVELRGVSVPPGRTLDGDMLETDSGWVATIRVEDDGKYVGKRVVPLEPGDCRKHDESLILVAALLLENGPTPSESAPPSEEPVTDTPPREPPPPPPAPPAPPAPPQELPPLRRFAVDVGGEYAPWRLGRLGFAVRLGGAFSVTPRFSLGLLAAFLPPTREEAEYGAILTSGVRARARACMASNSRWGVLGCVGAGMFGVWGKGRQVERPESSFFWSPELGATLGGTFQATEWISFRAEAELSVALRRGEMVFLPLSAVGPSEQEEVAVYTTGRLLPGGYLGVVLLF